MQVKCCVQECPLWATRRRRGCKRSTESVFKTSFKRKLCRFHLLTRVAEFLEPPTKQMQRDKTQHSHKAGGSLQSHVSGASKRMTWLHAVSRRPSTGAPLLHSLDTDHPTIMSTPHSHNLHGHPELLHAPGTPTLTWRAFAVRWQ